MVLSTFFLAVASSASAAPQSLPGRQKRLAEPTPQVIDFEGLAAGRILSAVDADRGAGPIGVRGRNPQLGNANSAVVFDSSLPTGGDDDLGSPNEDFGGPGIGDGGSAGSPFENARALGKVLIVAENLVDADGDGLVDDPDDANRDQTELELDFSMIAPVTLHSMTVIDVEGPAGPPHLELLDEQGHEILSLPLPVTGDNGVAVVDLGGVSGVYGMRIDMAGSGAIDDIVFARDCEAWIGDLVWNDLDRDGIQDEDEPGLAGVRVLLRNHVGALVGRTVSDRDGAYRFSELCGGTYYLEIDASSLQRDLLASDCDVGSDDRIDSDCAPAAVLLPSRTASNTSVDFGFNAPCSGSIGNFLWHDMDGDGVQGFDEPGLVNVKIDLFDDLGVLIGSATTGTNGVFSFDGLCAGTYSLEVDESTLPVNFSAGLCDVGGDDDLDSDCSPVTVVLPTDFVEDRSVDFGYVSPFTGVIGDFVFLDFDCDGLQDLDGFQGTDGYLAIDSGFADVGLILRDNMNVVVQTTNSGNGFPNLNGFLGGNEVGRYRFTGLPDGIYFVSVDESTLPPGYVASPCNPGIDDEIDNDCTEVMVVVDTSQGNVIYTFDFGYHPDPCDGFGCERDFWKNHLELWPAQFPPQTLFGDVFKDNIVHNKTLLEVLCLSGEGLNDLRRQAVTALLNAASGIDYALTVEQVIILFDDLFPATNPEIAELASYFLTLNSQSCPLDVGR